MMTREQAKTRWRGVVVPLVTPFQRDGALDLGALRANVQWLIDRGARAGNTVLLVAGSGGDFTSMNLEERKQVIRAVADVAAGRLPIIAGGQSLDWRESAAIGQLCVDAGVDAVQISGPFYYDGRPDDVRAWLAEVARHTTVGFALYNNWYTGYDMPIDLVERLLELPNSVGVKWSSPDVHTFYAGIRRLLPRVPVIDNTFLPIESHLLGCRAWVSHVPNFFPEHSWRVWGLMEAGRYPDARREYDRLMVPYLELVGQIQRATAGEGVFVKPCMAAVGLPAGHSRLPSRDEAVTPELREALRQLLLEAGAISPAGEGVAAPARAAGS